MMMVSLSVFDGGISYVFLGTVLVTTTQNQTFQCRKIILAIPPSQISSFDYFVYYFAHFCFGLVPIEFEPMLPGYKREMLKHMPIGSYLKFIFTFDKAFWREDGLSGEVISDGSFAPHGFSIGPMTCKINMQ
jgi:hypothetical protein